VSIYEEAAKKLPKDEEFVRNWFQQMVLRNNIDGARKVSLEWKWTYFRLQWC